MPLIEWNENLSVNISEFDQQHKKLIGMINELHDAMRKRKAKDVLGKIVDGLIDYTETHFSNEEKYLEQFNYPRIVTQKKEHSYFVKKITEFKKGFDEGCPMLSIDIMNFLKDWLVNHIQGTDKKYSAFLNEKGMK